MRKTLEPDWETAERLYPAIYELIKSYAEYCDENGDEDFTEYKNLENKLHEMTGKDMSEYALSEWWEGEGLEVLSFRVALPSPNAVQDITKEELTEIIGIIKEVPLPSNDCSFKDTFCYYIDDYYRECLRLNFKKYKPIYFNSQRGEDGKYFEYTVEEIVGKIWG